MNPDAAYVELAEAKKAVRAARRAFVRSPASAFVKTMQAVLADYLKARASGLSREDGIAGIASSLREAWPKSVSKFRPACDACDDTGYVDHVCSDQIRCGREVCARNPERQHGYVTPCHCAKGDRVRPKVRQAEDALAAVGRTAKKRGSWRQVGA